MTWENSTEQYKSGVAKAVSEGGRFFHGTMVYECGIDGSTLEPLPEEK